MKRSMVLLCVLISLAGCSRVVVVPGVDKTQQDFANDKYACMKEAGADRAGGWGFSEEMFNACMEVRGHRVTRQNKLTGRISD